MKCWESIGPVLNFPVVPTFSLTGRVSKFTPSLLRNLQAYLPHTDGKLDI